MKLSDEFEGSVENCEKALPQKQELAPMSDSTGLSHRSCLSFIQSKQCAHGAIMCMLLL